MSNLDPGFDWPKIYNFPPFFTIQPNEETKKKQLEHWCDLFLRYSEYFSLYETDIKSISKSQLFNNVQIKRTLPLNGIMLILSKLEGEGHICWIDSHKSTFIIMQMTPQTLSLELRSWIRNRSYVGAVYTVYELTNSDVFSKEIFHGMNQKHILMGLEVLQKDSTVELFTTSDSTVGFKVLKSSI